MRYPPLLLVALAVLAACGEAPAGLDPQLYSGTYILISINDEPVPTEVSTSWTIGKIVSGRLDIDLDANYWLYVRVEDAVRGFEDYVARGNVLGDGTGRLEFVDRSGEVQWIGTLLSRRLTVENFRELKASLEWISPYRRPA